ncbi:POT family-domain-containing protein [Aspergillus pseudonomiae]|uniref:POT family-domain-containing protein n=1 Tax=Aspergillus pseudonomiae TaxID=1506151 RepID=A0A5N7D7R9_9EURO|nr:POT family-domain-containing protein [Aspergillus pseudonomiae]KAB8265141.1 POT family-domain-containing protein [Aspergillus pseudonomiae]KAE8402245.1 POT family-domain-containing protein [Aspergillus pseudonomiae]
MPTLEPATERTPLLSVSSSSDDAAHDEGAMSPPPDGTRRIADSLPLSVWLVATIELCERFAFFGTLGPMQNYLQYARDDPLRPGGIGLGQAYATMVNQGFLLWCYITPVMGAIVAEQYLGRVKTIIHSSTLYICGLMMLFLSSLSIAHDLGVSLAGLLVALFFIGLGGGGIKANVSSLIAEQYTGPKEAKRVLDSGEEVIVDRALTIERIFSTFYLFTNIGSLGPLLTTTIEQKHGFSAAFSLPVLVFLIGFTVILSSKDQYVSRPPESSIVFNACRAFWIAIKHKGNLDYARPSYLAEAASDLETHANPLPWTDTFISDLRRALSSCKIFLLYPIYWAAYTQFLTNFISQAATMQTHGIPNDIMPNIDTITVLLLLPLVDRAVIPLLRRQGIPARHVHRIAAGFILIGTSMFYASFVQRIIYAAPPCYDRPRAPDCLGGRVPNQVSVFVQAPAYILVAGSEILAAVAGIEYAYTQAPTSMKSLVMAVYLAATSAGALLAMTVTFLTVDPLVPWLYVTLGLENFLAGGVLGFFCG